MADRLGLNFFRWQPTRGLHRPGSENFVYGTRQLAGALAHIDATRAPGVFHLQGTGDLLGDTAGKTLTEQLPPDPHTGTILSCRVGRAADEAIFANSQSGGVATAMAVAIP